ncbi:unnamed protein product, partial [Brassica rapa subsp. narinosa]
PDDLLHDHFLKKSSAFSNSFCLFIHLKNVPRSNFVRLHPYLAHLPLAKKGHIS